VAKKTAGGEYRAKVRVTAAGSVVVSVASLVGTTETLLSTKTLSGFIYTPASALQLRVDLTAGSSTQLSVKAWPAGSAEPTAWTVSATDGDPALQGAGQVGVNAYVSGSTTGGPLVVSVDDLDVR